MVQYLINNLYYLSIQQGVQIFLCIYWESESFLQIHIYQNTNEIINIH